MELLFTVLVYLAFAGALASWIAGAVFYARTLRTLSADGSANWLAVAAWPLALSRTMEKGNLSKWMKAEGDKVKAGDVIAEIETDKATMEVEAVDEGTLGKILVPEGTADVAVNTPIAVILSDGESASDIKAG